MQQVDDADIKKLIQKSLEMLKKQLKIVDERLAKAIVSGGQRPRHRLELGSPDDQTDHPSGSRACLSLDFPPPTPTVPCRRLEVMIFNPWRWLACSIILLAYLQISPLASPPCTATAAGVARAEAAADSGVAGDSGAASRAISFNQQIRHILSNNCYQCHGPDTETRKAGLRLDLPRSALRPADSGEPAIVPGQPDESELIRRIESDDPDSQMPPVDSKKSLTPSEKRLLRDWIAQGANFEQHWSFIAPRRPQPPTLPDDSWSRTPIDRFILSRLRQSNMEPTAVAPAELLIRRLSLDLTGLPPTIEEIEQFVGDEGPDAYERLVDRLLASPYYGERMALDWLDAARFADTNGYHLDNGRDMSAWRAWVIDAFNHNMPFDQFTVEQLAGDLLPNPTTEQLVASGFHRNHMINFEGGAIPAEYHHAYLVDRVNTTGTIWLGLTVGCAQCHDHKYDPITQRDYYQLYAFFHNISEKGLDGNRGNAEPLLRLPTAQQQAQLNAFDGKIADLQTRLETRDPAAPPNGENRQKIEEELAEVKKQRSSLEAQIPSTMIMRELPEPRETFVLMRGQYDKPTVRVTAAVPESLPPLPAGAPANRLGLAQWLVSSEQPLTSRVIANRLWQSFFGQGLVKTSEDFGTQGQMPSHPELLDWLAVELQSSSQPHLAGTEAARWNIKALVKLIVMSATYRQHSAVTTDRLEADPENRLYSRGPRFRLPAELIRDQALAVSGLLQHNIGGPSVSPYQPPGLWTELSSRKDSSNWTAQVFVQSTGPDLYRRSMYTFWKRTCPPPQMLTFDAPDRETCTVKRARTNTPLQALILLNDPTYIEASRKFAERILREGGGEMRDRMAFAFRSVTARQPTERELTVLSNILQAQRAIYAASATTAGEAEAATSHNNSAGPPEPALRDALLTTGESAYDVQLDKTELAAWTMVASTLLNLDETVTRN